jgi:hypothetical protein
MLSNARVIGIYGSKGVGKDFVGKELYEVIQGSEESRRGHYGDNPMATLLALADPIKDYVIKHLGIPHSLAYGSDEDKNTLTDYLWEKMPFKHDKKGRMSVREIIQTVGTELGRDVWGNNIWLNNMHNRIDYYAGMVPKCVVYAIITDVRFDNEVNVIRSWGGVIWGVKGPQRIKKTGDSHSSERQHDIALDAIIINDVGTTKEQVGAQIKENFAKWLSTTSTALSHSK